MVCVFDYAHSAKLRGEALHQHRTKGQDAGNMQLFCSRVGVLWRDLITSVCTV